MTFQNRNTNFGHIQNWIHVRFKSQNNNYLLKACSYGLKFAMFMRLWIYTCVFLRFVRLYYTVLQICSHKTANLSQFYLFISFPSFCYIFKILPTHFDYLFLILFCRANRFLLKIKSKNSSREIVKSRFFFVQIRAMAKIIK